jgi:hypothetical protein
MDAREGDGSPGEDVAGGERARPRYVSGDGVRYVGALPMEEPDRFANGPIAMPARDPDRDGIPDDCGRADAERPAAGRIRRLPFGIRSAGKHRNPGGRPPGGLRGRRMPSLPLLKCLEKPDTP